MDYVLKVLNLENIDEKDVICVANKKNQVGIDGKKAWLKERFAEGLKIHRYEISGKAFIEYMPSEVAWKPVEAEGYLMIHCFWISGKHKGNGLSKELFAECLEDAKGKKGILAVACDKPFFTPVKFYEHLGFKVVDEVQGMYKLMLLPLSDEEHKPRFCEKAREGRTEKEGVYVEYTYQCPYTSYYVNEMAMVAEEKGIPFEAKLMTTLQDVRESGSPFGTCGFFVNGEFASHEVMTAKRFEKELKRFNL